MQLNYLFSIFCNVESCPSGTYFNSKNKACYDCPKDTYQEDYGRFHCNKCPLGTFTIGTKTKNSTNCRGIIILFNIRETLLVLTSKFRLQNLYLAN